MLKELVQVSLIEILYVLTSWLTLVLLVLLTNIHLAIRCRKIWQRCTWLNDIDCLVIDSGVLMFDIGALIMELILSCYGLIVLIQFVQIEYTKFVITYASGVGATWRFE